MERHSKTVSIRTYGLAGLAFHVFNRLIAGHRNAGTLLAAAREISHAANRQHVAHAALSQIADRIYRKHSILTAPLEQDERMEYTVTQESEVNVEECLVLAQAELQAAKAQLVHQISNFPGPIADNDCRFSHLLAMRAKVATALAALELEFEIASPKRA